jgi:hypothetical protein
MGAVPLAHVTPENQFTVNAPPFVISKINDAAVPAAGTFVTVNVVVPVIVFVK